MLLRSFSTPILGSLLSSSSSSPFFSESPANNDSHHHHHHRSERSSSSSSSSPYDVVHHPNRCRFPHLSGSSDRDPSSFGFRRAHSDGNLNYLLPNDSHHLPVKSSPSGRRTNPVLETIPSFSMYNSKGEEEEPQEDEEEEECGGGLTRSVTIGDIITAEFGFSCDNKNVGLDENSRENGKVCGKAVPPLYLARGLGIDRLGSGIMNAGGGGGGGKFVVRTGNGGEQFDMETYYKMMVDENPADALFLRNYAQFLYQTKGDPRRAEEYCSRAILADPSDGEILSQYAKLVWEQHHDEERASSYFERAVQATPDDSHVLAAYAGFLWEKEDNGVESGEGGQLQDDVHGALASATI
ncbi:RNA-processing protein [Cocos nucifera]|uniref:RNA-processing protein n=1 Tax=Cocos nucifera TaxID=13894 RepID=A0A8K0IE49_COCNU|nr:RNA-processing protein [Cocos nucifera]